MMSRSLLMFRMPVRVKATIIVLAGSLFGWLGGTVYGFFQAENAKTTWYEPAIWSVGASGAFMVLSKLLDWWKEGRREKTKRQDKQDYDDDQRHMSLAQELGEMTTEQWRDVIARRDRLHEEQTKFLQSQITQGNITKYDLRQRSQLAMDEVTKLQAYARRLETSLLRNNLEYAEYPMRSYLDIMDGVEAKVAEFARQLAEQHVAAE
jgi:hypothetical protein